MTEEKHEAYIVVRRRKEAETDPEGGVFEIGIVKEIMLLPDDEFDDICQILTDAELVLRRAREEKREP